MKSPCRYVEGLGYLLRSHNLGCRDIDCQGCEPCSYEEVDGQRQRVRHCTGRNDPKRCTSHLGAQPLTCPECIGRTRKQLEEIAVWHERDLLLEAMLAGVDSEAAMLAGPAAYAKVTITKSARQIELLKRDDAELHPLNVLGVWDFMLREDYGLTTDELCSVASASAFLRGLLTRLAQDETQDWPLFAREISDCHHHLATVLHVSRWREKGAPCNFGCDPAPPMVKRYRNRNEGGWPALDGSADFWECPDCEKTCTEAEYRLYVSEDYLDNATALTASDLAMVYGVPMGTTRRWANGDQACVKKRGYDGSGRQLYDVEDVKSALAKREEASA